MLYREKRLRVINVQEEILFINVNEISFASKAPIILVMIGKH